MQGPRGVNRRILRVQPAFIWGSSTVHRKLVQYLPEMSPWMVVKENWLKDDSWKGILKNVLPKTMFPDKSLYAISRVCVSITVILILLS